MTKIFQKIDEQIHKLMRGTVRFSLLALLLLAIVAWPAQAQMGTPLYAIGFTCCAASAFLGKRALVAFGRALIPTILLQKFTPVPDHVARRLRGLLEGMSVAHIGIYMPKKDDGTFVLGIYEDEKRGDILISERVLRCKDDVLRMMLGHELGHLQDPPERSAPRNDLILFAWCVFLAYSGAPTWMVVAIYALRLVVVGSSRLLECWIREVRADIHGFYLFNESRLSEQFFRELEAATAEALRLHKRSPVEWKKTSWIAPTVTIATIVVLFPNFAVFAAIDIVSRAVFLLLPTTHPPVDIRRKLVHGYLKNTTA